MAKFSFTFDKNDKGKYGDAAEMLVKYACGISNPWTITEKGKPDFKLGRRSYDVKQNGTVIKYNANDRTYVRGSSRIVYTTHLEQETIDNGDGTVTVMVDMASTQWYVLDKREFIKFLESINGIHKVNEARNEVNVQTFWNYKKDAWHGSKGRQLEAWAWEHALEDDGIVDKIMEVFG